MDAYKHTETIEDIEKKIPFKKNTNIMGKWLKKS